MDVYVRFSRKPVARTLEDTRSGVVVDVDSGDELVGVELLGAMAVRNGSRG